MLHRRTVTVQQGHMGCRCRGTPGVVASRGVRVQLVGGEARG